MSPPIMNNTQMIHSQSGDLEVNYRPNMPMMYSRSYPGPNQHHTSHPPLPHLPVADNATPPPNLSNVSPDVHTQKRPKMDHHDSPTAAVPTPDIEDHKEKDAQLSCPCCKNPIAHHVRNLALEEVLKKEQTPKLPVEGNPTLLEDDPVNLATKYKEQLYLIEARLEHLEKESGEIGINVKDKKSKLEKARAVIEKAEDGISKISANIEKLRDKLKTLDAIVQDNLPIRLAIEKSIQTYENRRTGIFHEKSALVERKERVYTIWKGLSDISK
ncbi:hypothetical protein HDV01_006487 [Terramyces sp. JEL0728]|nr:hypothetical protein HDV01_006487 [Terramyces sp. JEL0728]